MMGNIVQSVYNRLANRINTRWLGSLQAASVVRSIRLQLAIKPFLDAAASLHVMDAGCGENAALVSILAGRYARHSFTGVDLFLASSTKAKQANLKLHLKLLEEFTAVEPFDVVYSLDVLEHVPDPQIVLKRIADSLKPGGVLILHVPAMPQKIFFKSSEESSHPTFRQERPGDSHLREGFTIDELTSLLVKVGIEIKRWQRTFGSILSFFKEIYTIGERHSVKGIGLMLLSFIVSLSLCEILLEPRRGNGLLVIAVKKS